MTCPSLARVRLAQRPRAAPGVAWALCTVARSGSTWLSQLIASTELLGNPAEYLLNWKQQSANRGLPDTTTIEEYLFALTQHRATPNGIFAVKGSYSELEPFFHCFPAAPCVWLTRENRLEQAVSWHRAHDGGVWTAEQGGGSQSWVGSVERVLWFYDEILRREGQWREFFAARRSPPLLLTYESVCRDPLAAVREIAMYLGVEPERIVQVSSRMKIVRDQQSAGLVRLAEAALEKRVQGSGFRVQEADRRGGGVLE